MATARKGDKRPKAGRSKRALKETPLIDGDRVLVMRSGTGTYFDCWHHAVGRLHTSCPVEAAAALMRVPAYAGLDKLWSMKVPRELIEAADPVAALYWMTGGDGEWLSPDRSVSWTQAAEAFGTRFGEPVWSALQLCRTMADVRTVLYEDFPFLSLLEFGLQNKLQGASAV